jgi:hypothetical protein
MSTPTNVIRFRAFESFVVESLVFTKLLLSFSNSSFVLLQFEGNISPKPAIETF